MPPNNQEAAERCIPQNHTGRHRYPALELVRLTLPRRVYTSAHMEAVVEGLRAVWRRREHLRGLRMVYEPPVLRFFTARFTPL